MAALRAAISAKNLAPPPCASRPHSAIAWLLLPHLLRLHAAERQSTLPVALQEKEPYNQGQNGNERAGDDQVIQNLRATERLCKLIPVGQPHRQWVVTGIVCDQQG